MWFGDLVTMRWWDDLWLNESFAEWASHFANTHATRFHDAWATFANQRKGWAYRQDQLPTTHPIAATWSTWKRCTSTSTASPTRRAPRVAATRRVRGRGGLPQGTALLLRAVRLVQHQPQRPAHRACRCQRPGPRHTGPNSGCRPLGSTCCGPRSRPARTVPWARWQFYRARQPCPKGVEPTLRDHRIAIGLYELREGAPSGLIRWRSM